MSGPIPSAARAEPTPALPEGKELRGPALFARLAGGDEAARERLVELYLPLARRLASRFHRTNEERDDLEQVAALALVKAIDRYDPERGRFESYAVPSITGELKRHLRDRTWTVHVARSVQENFLLVNTAIGKLTSALGRSPTLQEIAGETGLSIEDAVEAVEVASAHSPEALDAPRADPSSEEAGGTLAETLGGEDPHFDVVEYGAAIGPAFRELGEREQAIVHLRFVEDLPQSAIAKRVGISQMQVSRLLRSAVEQLTAAARSGEETP